MKLWLDKVGPYKVDRIDVPHSTEPATMTAPPKGILHTTEPPAGASYTNAWQSALNVFRQHYAPTFQVGQGELAQFSPIGAMAAALENHPGGVETNRLVRVQIEIVGNSKATPWLPDPKTFDTLAQLLVVLETEAGIPLTHTPNPKRDPNIWGKASGWLGHADVPENSHWDPGALKYDDLFAYTDTIKNPSAQPWPLPIPKWFWAWARWRLGRDEYQGHANDLGVRPPDAPATIPDWAWARLKSFIPNHG